MQFSFRGTATLALTLTLLAATLGACATRPPVPETASGPPLVFETFFPGKTVGEGVFTNSWTGSQRKFDVVIEGTWDGRTLTLVEDFVFADGEKDRKTWRLEQTGPGTFVGTREDVVGQAKAWTDGKAVRLEYTVNLGGFNVDFSDVLVLTAPDALLNKAVVGKWGLRVGRVELVLRRAAGS